MRHRHACARELGRLMNLKIHGEKTMTQNKARLAAFYVAGALAMLLCVVAQTAKADNLGNDPCGVSFTVSHPDTIGRGYVTQLVYTPPPGFKFTNKDLVKGPNAPKY